MIFLGQSASDVGRVGEFLAAYILETHGVEVHHVDRSGADLWCRVKDRIVTVQVKACMKPGGVKENTRSPPYRYLVQSSGADWFAFVALDRQLLLMRPALDVEVSTVRIASSEFNEVNQRRTIAEMLGE